MEASVIRHFQERMPYGLFVPDVPWGTFAAPVYFLCGALNKTSSNDTRRNRHEGSRNPAPGHPPQAVDSRAGFSFWRKTNNGTGRAPRCRQSPPRLEWPTESTTGYVSM